MKFSSDFIGSHVEKVQNWSPAQSEPNNVFTYIDLSSVDKDKKIVDLTETQFVSCKNAPSRAKQLVNNEDILVATVRPNLNGVAKVPFELNGSTASTGYCVLRANGKTLHPDYLFYWVQSKTFIGEMMRKATGANYPAISDKTIKQSRIPLPPITDQQKIAEILDAADALRQKDQQLITHYTALSQSLFLDMFGDPVSNSNHWIKSLLNDSADKITKGGSPKWQGFDYVSSGVRFITSENVLTNNISLQKEKFIPDEFNEKIRNSKLESGDILLNIVGASAGRAGLVLDEHVPANINQAVAKITLSLSAKITNKFLVFLLNEPHFNQSLLGDAVESARLNLSLGGLKKLEIITPPLVLQNQFADRIALIEQQKQQAEASLAQSNNLFNSLLQKAFTGELTQQSERAA